VTPSKSGEKEVEIPKTEVVEPIPAIPRTIKTPRSISPETLVKKEKSLSSILQSSLTLFMWCTFRRTLVIKMGMKIRRTVVIKKGMKNTEG